jgi:hypothetical protein
MASIRLEERVTVLLGIQWDRMVRCRRYQNTRDGVLPTPEAGVLPSTESLQAAGRPPPTRRRRRDPTTFDTNSNIPAAAQPNLAKPAPAPEKPPPHSQSTIQRGAADLPGQHAAPQPRSLITQCSEAQLDDLQRFMTCERLRSAPLLARDLAQGMGMYALTPRCLPLRNGQAGQSEWTGLINLESRLAVPA